MRKKIIAAAFSVVICVFLLGGCAGSGKNCLKTGEDNTFAYDDFSALKKDWDLVTASNSSVSKVFSMSDGALIVNTEDSGWARAAQRVNLAPHSRYMIEYTFDAHDFSPFTVDKAYEGLYVTFLEDKEFNAEVEGSDESQIVHHRTPTSSKNTGRIYFKTDSAIKTTLAINIGSEDYPVSVDKVSIYDIKLVRVKKSQIASDGAACMTFNTDTYGESGEKNVAYVVFGALAMAALAYAAYVMYRRNLSFDGEYGNGFLKKFATSKYAGVLTVASAAFLLRLLIDLLVTCLAGAKARFTLGYEVEGLAAQALFIGKHGTPYLRESLSQFCSDNGYVYMVPASSPLLLYSLGLIGLIGRIFEKSDPYLATTFFVKLFAALADVGSVILIYMMLKKHAGNVGAAVMSGMYALLPLSFGMSALWGYTESTAVFLFLLVFYFLLNNKYYGVAASYFAAFLFAQTAVYLIPIILFYTIMQVIRQKNLRIPAAIAPFLCFGLFYALNAPFDYNQIRAGKPFACVTNYWNMVFKDMKYTMNAFNFQAVLKNNFENVSDASLIVSVIFALFILTLVGIGYFKSKNRMNLTLLTTAYLNMMFSFSNCMKPQFPAISLALMLVYAVANEERRVYFSFAALSLLTFVNVAVGETLYEYAAAEIFRISYDTATIYVFGSFALVFALYYLYISYDIVASRKMSKIPPMALTYGGWWRNLFLRAKKSYYGLRKRMVK